MSLCLSGNTHWDLSDDGNIPDRNPIVIALFFDIRIISVPTIYGERISMRLLRKANLAFGLKSLGFSDQNLKALMDAMQAPSGLLLIVGPTGSGKTTTLFSILSELKDITKNIKDLSDSIASTANDAQLTNQQAKDLTDLSSKLQGLTEAVG